MSASAEISIRTTNGDTGKRTYTYVNPTYVPEYGTDTVAVSAINSIRAAVIAINSLSTDAITSIALISKTDITTEA